MDNGGQRIGWWYLQDGGSRVDKDNGSMDNGEGWSMGKCNGEWRDGQW